MRHTLLLIDDDSNISKMLSNVFRFEGFEALTADNGRKGLDILTSQQTIEVVICDIKMPEMDGETVLSQICYRHPLIPVIMLTGFLELETAVNVMRKGAFDYITKPVENDMLLTVVERAFQHRERMIEDLRKRGQAEKMAALGRLTAGFVHNLNNPLSCVIAYAEFLKGKYPQETRLDKLLSASNKMYTIISSMLHQARQGHHQRRERININQIISEEMSFFEADLEFKHQIEKRVDLAIDLPEIEGVYSDVSQCLSNLIKNALDAMRGSAHKLLTIKTGWNSQNIWVEITDTGCGIKKEDLSKLFEPFFTTKTKENGQGVQGTGLGLYSSYQLLKPYGVNFEVKSQLGEGATFQVLFPASLAIQTEALAGKT